MDGVKRYDCSGTMCQSEDGDWVSSSDFDAALAREAALREELAKAREAAKEELDGVKYTRRKFRQERDDLQQRLTAAEQRNAELVELLSNVSESVTGRNGTFARIPADWFDKRDAVLKPTESGASE